MRALRDWLRTQVVTVVSDFDHAARPPKAGWPTWMQHSIADATVVLVVCSPNYKLRFEKRADPDSGKGVTWEGAVITQDLYNAAQRNDKFYPIFLDPVNMGDVPKALEPWNNGHSFPSKQDGILELIRECFADAAPAPTLANAPGVAAGAQATTATPQQASITQANDPSDNAAARIEQTRQVICAWLRQENFPSALELKFDGQGMPQLLAVIFNAVTPDTTRASVADQCLIAIPQLAKTCLEKLDKLPETASPISAKTKAAMRAAFINAMQQAILLAAREDKLQTARLQAAYHANTAQALDVNLWLSVSVLTRDDLAEHVRADFPPGKLAVFRDKHHVNLFDEIELGTSENRTLPRKDLPALEKTDRQGAETAVCKIVWNTLFPGEAPYQSTQFDVFQGELRELKDNNKHLLVIMEPQNGQLSREFVNWLNQQMHLGVIKITTTHGLFDISEGTWRAKLATLYKTLQPLEPTNRASA